MTCEELQEAISRTIAEIEEVKLHIQTIPNTKEKRRLIRRKREMQYLQLWHLNQLKGME
jgi:hypothetical protein